MSDTLPSPSPSPSSFPPADQAALHGRPIRSFVLRTGRTTVGQAKALQDLGPQYLLPYQDHTIDLIADCAAFPWATGLNDAKNKAPTAAQATKPATPSIAKVVLEIGYGMGEATAHIAQLMPDTLIVACEVHPPGVGALLKRIGEQGIGNIRIIQHDAVQVLTHMIAPDSLDGVHIFFPDPWHKKRHNKRRLVQPPLVALLASRIKPGGYLHCATDWQNYAEQILQVLSDEPSLANTAHASTAANATAGEGASAGSDGYAPKPSYRPLTKFENRGIKLGHGVWDVVFKRQIKPN